MKVYLITEKHLKDIVELSWREGFEHLDAGISATAENGDDAVIKCNHDQLDNMQSRYRAEEEAMRILRKENCELPPV